VARNPCQTKRDTEGLLFLLVKSIVLLIPIVSECIDQFNLTTAEGFVTYLRAANATGALTTRSVPFFHGQSDRTAVVIINGLSLSR
jgi:hypothetical protein